ncbi:MAG: hypothetical protein ACR2JO_07935 [Mycobacteriales bacterium]
MSCLDCGRPMVSERAPDRPAGTVTHGGRGLCRTCRARHAYRGDLHDYPTVTNHWVDYVGDYAMLRGEGYRLYVIAGRLGMTEVALNRALERHRDDPRARRPGAVA